MDDFNDAMDDFNDTIDDRPRHYKKPEIYLWEKIMLIDHDMHHVPNIARRNRWFQMAKISHLGK